MSKQKNKIEAKLAEGFNHTYKFNIEIRNFPKPILDDLDKILDKLNMLCALVGAEYSEEFEND